MMDYWCVLQFSTADLRIDFTYCSDPNGDGSSGRPNWPTHSYPENKNSLELDAGSVKVIQDDFREEAIAMFNEPQNAFYVRKRGV